MEVGQARSRYTAIEFSCKKAQHHRPVTGNKARAGPTKSCGGHRSKHVFLQGLPMNTLMQWKPVNEVGWRCADLKLVGLTSGKPHGADK